MLDATKLLANALGEHLALVYRRTFGSREPGYVEVIEESARLTVERIAQSDALYHDADHTILVTLVAQDILRGRFVAQGVSPNDWLHAILAALYHDIGYVRGVCAGDSRDRFVIDRAGNTVGLPRGASDAGLTAHHVERSKIAVWERFSAHEFVDAERVARAIELTRFPVPDDGDHSETGTEAGLMRAADLIGQLGDPLYPRKLNALFHEFVEAGLNDTLGYANPADLAERYPAFFWGKVEPVIGDGVRALDLTVEGRRWVANLYAHVFAIEHDRRRMGPHPG
ncbi:metal-dependent phosphohydrolase [uncultured Methylobacterium sp.]|uniref:metal-dependent phosphohydrolase n=1 Tax=uncultured Methylobacterium sp. TaxID=157278 RepID=UPI0035CB4C1A